MGIARIKLGPKSRFAEAQEAMPPEVAETVERVLAEASPQDFAEAAAASVGCVVCGCGRERLLDRHERWTDEAGVVHLANIPCHPVAGSKQAGRPLSISLEARVVALEKAVTNLVVAKDLGPRCVCGCTWAEHQGHIDADWTLVAGACLSCACTDFLGTSVPAKTCCGGGCHS